MPINNNTDGRDLVPKENRGGVNPAPTSAKPKNYSPPGQGGTTKTTRVRWVASGIKSTTITTRRKK